MTILTVSGRGVSHGDACDIVTLFPEMCQQVLDSSIIGRAAKKGYIETHCHQIRDYTLNKQKQTDDYPYGGGCGMVLYAQPIADCLRAVQKEVRNRDARPAYRVPDGRWAALYRGARPAAWPSTTT